jgi:hypothetical protein
MATVQASAPDLSRMNTPKTTGYHYNRGINTARRITCPLYFSIWLRMEEMECSRRSISELTSFTVTKIDTTTGELERHTDATYRRTYRHKSTH